MILNKRAFELHKLSGEGFIMDNVLVDNGVIVVSDGKRLIKYSPGIISETDIPNMGVKKGCDFKALIPASNFKKISVLIAGSKNPLVVMNADESEAHIVIKDGDTPIRLSPKKSDAVYPDYASVFPEGAPVAEIVVNPQLLSSMLEHFCLQKPFPAVRISIYPEKDGSTPAMKLTASTDFESMEGLLMPLTREVADPEYWWYELVEMKDNPAVVGIQLYGNHDKTGVRKLWTNEGKGWTDKESAVADIRKKYPAANHC